MNSFSVISLVVCSRAMRLSVVKNADQIVDQAISCGSEIKKGISTILHNECYILFRFLIKSGMTFSSKLVLLAANSISKVYMLKGMHPEKLTMKKDDYDYLVKNPLELGDWKY